MITVQYTCTVYLTLVESNLLILHEGTQNGKRERRINASLKQEIQENMKKSSLT